MFFFLLSCLYQICWIVPLIENCTWFGDVRKTMDKAWWNILFAEAPSVWLRTKYTALLSIKWLQIDGQERQTFNSINRVVTQFVVAVKYSLSFHRWPNYIWCLVDISVDDRLVFYFGMQIIFTLFTVDSRITSWCEPSQVTSPDCEEGFNKFIRGDLWAIVEFTSTWCGTMHK